MTRWLRYAINCLLIVALAYVGLELAQLLRSPGVTLSHVSATTALSHREAEPQQKGPQAISHHIRAMHLLGETTSSGEVIERTPVTHLDLTLKGVIAFADNGAGLALIGTGGDSGVQVYGKGDTVTGGVSIYEIAQDGVILSRRGHLERLNLRRNDEKLIKHVSSDAASRGARIHPESSAEHKTSSRHAANRVTEGSDNGQDSASF